MVKTRNYTKKKVPYQWPIVAGVPEQQPAKNSLRSGKIRNGHEHQAVRPTAVAGATKKIWQSNNENLVRKIKSTVGEDGMGKQKDLVEEQVEKDMWEEADTKGNTSTMVIIGVEVAAEVESEFDPTVLELNGGDTENSFAVVIDFVVANESELAVNRNSDCTAEDLLSVTGCDAIAGGDFDNETSRNSCNYERGDITVSGAEDNSSVTQATTIVKLTNHRNHDGPCGKRSISADEAFRSGYLERTRQEMEDSVEKSGNQMSLTSAHETSSGVQETSSESLPGEPFSSTDLSCKAAGLLENESVALGSRHPSLIELVTGTNGEEYEVGLVTMATAESTQGAQDTFTQQISELNPSYSLNLTCSQRELENNCTALCVLDGSNNCESYVSHCPCRPLNTDGETMHELTMVVGSGSKKKRKEIGGKTSHEISEVKRRNALGRYKRQYSEEHRIRLYGCKMFVALRADLTQGENLGLTTIPLWRICRLQKVLRKYEPVEIDGRDCHFATNYFLRITDDDDLVITYQPVLFDMLFDTQEGAVGLVYDVPRSTPLLGYFPLCEFEMNSDFQPFLRRVIGLALGKKSFNLGEDCEDDAIETSVDRGIKSLCRSECFLEVFPRELMVTTAMGKYLTLKKLKNCKQQSLCTSCRRLQRLSAATFSVELGRSPNESDLKDLGQPLVCHDMAWIFCSLCVKQLEAIHKLMLFKFRLFCAFRVELSTLYAKLKKGQKYATSELAKFLEGDIIHNKVLFYEFLTAYYGARDTELKIMAQMEDVRNDPNMAIIPLLPVTEAEPSVASLRNDDEAKSVDSQNYVGTPLAVAGCHQIEAASRNHSKTISSGRTKKLLSATSDHNISSESGKVKRRVLKAKTNNTDLEKCADLAPSNSMSSRNLQIGRKSKVSEVQSNEARVPNANAAGGTAVKSSRGTRPRNSIQHSKYTVEVESQISASKCSGSTAFGSPGVCNRNRVESTVEQAPRECNSKDSTEIVPVAIIRKSARIPKKKEVFSPARTNEMASKKVVAVKTLFPLNFEDNSVQKGMGHEVKRSNYAKDSGCGNVSSKLNRPFAKNVKHFSRVLSTFADENKYVAQRTGKISKRKNRRPSLIVKIPLDILPSATKFAQEHFVVRREANKKVYERKSKVSVTRT